MLDTGSPRVFNCNEMSRRVLAQNPDAPPFFANKALNAIVLIKDTVPEEDRRAGAPSVGMKLYFPFNENEIYEGGRTIFYHAKGVEKAILDYCGESAVSRDALDRDLRIMSVLARIPSLDPFLMKDIFLQEKINVHEAYLEVSQEAWEEIELYMLQKFEPLITAAFPDVQSSDDKARQLIDKIWEAQDLDALMPLITAFRLPREKALEIFSSWKGIVYYSYQYMREQTNFLNLLKWIGQDIPSVGVSSEEKKKAAANLTLVKDQLRLEWQKTDEIVRSYQSSYDKMFKDKTSSTEFLTFLKNSDKTYWQVGNCLGKVNHATYCWEVMTSRYDDRKLPWGPRQEVIGLLAKIMEPEKKAATSMAWS